MSSTASSPARIEKVSSDSVVIGFDLLSNLIYMSVLSLEGLARDRVLEHCARQKLKTSVFFEYVYLLAKRTGLEYTRAFQLVAEKARASVVKSLLLRFAACISSGESERDFIAQEARIETERYTAEYDRSVENTKKWTEAYSALLVSVTLVMVVSLVSTMMSPIGQSFILLMGLTVFGITVLGVYIIYRVVPAEQKTYDGASGTTRERRKARTLLVTLVPVGVALSLLLGPRFDLLPGFAIAFVLIGLSMAPAGFLIWKDDAKVTRLDAELATFLRSVGNVAGATGVTLTEALKRIDIKSLGSLEPYIERLRVRLDARLSTYECWERFREETGSELANRTTRMLVDGSELGGRADQVGHICSDFALNVSQLRAKRQLMSSTFTFLTIPMHATMVFILVFVLEIIAKFNAMLAKATEDVLQKAGGVVSVPEGLELPPGISAPTGAGDLGAGLAMFEAQDLSFTFYVFIGVVLVLTLANSLAPKAAAGGSNLKIASFLSILCVISGGILGVVPMLSAKLFAM